MSERDDIVPKISAGETAPATGVTITPGDHGFTRGTNLGRYVVLERLGGGGMGVVYAAYDGKLDRRVALKLLRPDATGNPEARERLVREAQALARLAHPNVVSIHDVGEFQGEVFLEMEFMGGGTLTDWLTSEPHGWREVLDVFLQAGRGLAAAHDVGIIHRDFKPDNVLLGKDGQVKVADFGLARASAGDPTSARAMLPATNTESDPIEGLSPRLTHAGSFRGTPAYMSPEQRRGEEVGARSDQYTFCVALYEALVGERPSRRDVALRTRGGVVRGRGEPPAKLLRVATRGLSTDPAARYPSMTALLGALRGAVEPRWRRGGWIVAAAAALVSVSALVVAHGHSRAADRVCLDARARLGDVWDDGARAAVRAAFGAAGVPYAADELRSVEHGLDAYGDAWVAMQQDACLATRVRKEQTDEVLALRTACLDRRRDEMSALVGVLRRADRDVVTHAADAVSALVPLDRCSDWRALASRVPPPPAAQAEAVAAVRRDLAQAKALYDASLFREGIPIAEKTDAAASAIGYHPVEAEARLELGLLREGDGDPKGADAALRDAVLHAEAGGDDLVATQAWSALVWVDAKADRLDQGTADAAHARAWVERSSDDAARAALDENLGVLTFEQGKYPDAEASDGEAVAIEERRLGPDSPRVAKLLAELTDDRIEQNHYDGAVETYQRSLDILRRSFGRVHPEVGKVLHSLAIVELQQGHPQQALADMREAASVNEAALGPDHPTVARTLLDLADMMRDLDAKLDPEAKQLLERALAIQEKTIGPDHPDVSRTLEGLGTIDEDLGDPVAARAEYDRALTIVEKALGPEHRRVEDILDDLARLDLAQGSPRDALPLGKRALGIVTKALGPEHPYVADSLTIIGRADVALHRPADALDVLERALVLRGKGDAMPDEIAETQFALAQALWDAGGDRARARDLAAKARAGYSGASAFDVQARERVDAWLKSAGD